MTSSLEGAGSHARHARARHGHPRHDRRGAAAKNLIGFLLLLLLAGCGFRPLYAPGAPQVDEGLAAIRVNPIPERIGQILAIELRDSLNPTDVRVPKRYVLYVSLTTQRNDVAIRPDATASRVNYNVSASFQLFDTKQNKTVLSSTTRSLNSFDILENEYATIVAEKDARDRAAHELARQIRTRLALYVRQAARSP